MTDEEALATITLATFTRSIREPNSGTDVGVMLQKHGVSLEHTVQIANGIVALGLSIQVERVAAAVRQLAASAAGQ